GGRTCVHCVRSVRARGKDIPVTTTARTLTDRIWQSRVKRPDLPLAEAIAAFVADKPLDGNGIAPTTLRAYELRLGLFHDWLPERRRFVRDLEIEAAERFVRTAANQNTRRNLAITLRSF